VKKEEGSHHIQLILDLGENVHVSVLGGGWICHCCAGECGGAVRVCRGACKGQSGR
jgi:hypothetical protein